MASAKRRGVHVGRPPALSREQVTHVRELRAEGKKAPEIAPIFGVSPNTIRRVK